nr:MAG TPA: hypothetical protein [Caudoviricetes sp.]DAT34254.1 MAG TPA: hypothetical protein [Caudoviricetes sp.]DAV08809.1 MAG TPA: hypothetical protein [Caudoviricetes sp.]
MPIYIIKSLQVRQIYIEIAIKEFKKSNPRS